MEYKIARVCRIGYQIAESYMERQRQRSAEGPTLSIEHMGGRELL